VRNGHPAEILLVEDNPLDAEATLAAAEELNLVGRVHHVRDGAAALDFLFRRGPYTNVQRPDLVLLDLNLPGLDGREVLRVIKNHVTLRTLPVVVLTTSERDEDVQRAYESGANAYVRKPVGPEGFMAVVNRIESFWMGTALLPPQSGTFPEATG
jgi:two-component system, chemotaxis family, response regulator Rcp1